MKLSTTRKIFKNSKYSYAVTVPPEMIRVLKFREKQKVVLEMDTRTKRIVIKDWKK